MLGQFFQIYNWSRQLRGLLTDQRAANLDNLDTTVSSRLSSDAAATQFSTLADGISTRAQRSKVVIFDTPGSGIFTVPEGVYLLWLSLCGGGAGGCAIGSGGSGQGTGTTGGGGMNILRLPVNVTPGQIISYAVGNGGNGIQTATAASVSAGNGEASYFGAYISYGGTAGAGYVSGGTTVISARGVGGYLPFPKSLFVGSKTYDGSVSAWGNLYYIQGANGSDNTLALTPSVFSIFNFAGSGGAAGKVGTSLQYSNGYPGIIILEMESAA